MIFYRIFTRFTNKLTKGHFTFTPKPNRNRTEKLKCLKPYERFHICAETEPKPNAEPKTCTNLILFFSVSVTEFQQIRQVIFDKICTYTTTYVVYNLVIMKAIDGCPARQLCDYFTSAILLTTEFCGTIPRATIKTTYLMQ